MPAMANAKRTVSFTWDQIIEAIIQVESEGDVKAQNGKSIGAMQITPIMVKDCNRILAERNEKKRYTMDDRFSVEKSKEMFHIFQSHYNPNKNIEHAIRLWNGGVKYTKGGTQNYYDKVMKALTSF